MMIQKHGPMENRYANEIVTDASTGKGKVTVSSTGIYRATFTIPGTKIVQRSGQHNSLKYNLEAKNMKLKSHL